MIELGKELTNSDKDLNKPYISKRYFINTLVMKTMPHNFYFKLLNNGPA